ncbi:DUF2515 family protein [Neobacillus sp. D3-1R]|uniref:DUF2515 family protein n=1 Tax=Neobacillus sp. D3-1R TaxID=3445778 RepID=UPI003FA12D13
MCPLGKNRLTRLSKHLMEIKNELKNKKPIFIDEKKLSENDQRLIERIRKITTENNLNNIVRTKAYLEFYQKYPEIHWSFLAHMVSRNGGWNMTDLEGEYLSRLLSRSSRQAFFSFLERGNWLIFQDAYPQLLLYEESLRSRKNYFYLLPFLNISLFMETIWNHYWIKKDPNILTIGLIVNEQNYIEERVVQNPLLKEKVFNSIEFKIQDLLSFNQILLPYEQNNKVRFLGQTVHHFDSLHERILIGKRLYNLLFQSEDIANSVLHWAIQNPHTASRKDYWPNLFNDIKEGVPGLESVLKVNQCKLIPGSMRLYSPRLEIVWKNVHHKQAEPGDWFKDWKVVEYLMYTDENINGDIMSDYCQTLEKLDLTTAAKKVIFD